MNKIKCVMCGNFIERGDTEEGWIKITKEWYMLGGERIPRKTYYICGDCRYNFLSKNPGLLS